MRVFVLTTEYGLATHLAFQTLAEHKALKRNGIEIVGVASTQHVSGWNAKAWQRLWRLMQKAGVWFAVKNVLFTAWQALWLRLAKYFWPNHKRHLFEVEEICVRHRIPYYSTPSVNNATTLKLIKKSRAQVVVSCLLLEKVGAELLALPELGAINFHPALFTHHRGTFSGFWALLNGHKHAGATVHYMTENFDEGDIITQRRFFIKPSYSMSCVNEKSGIIGGALLAKALVKIKRRKAKVSATKGWAPLQSSPTLAQAQAFAKRYSLFRFKNLWRV